MLWCHVVHNPLEKQLKQIGNGRTIRWNNRRRIRVMAAKRSSKFDTQVLHVSPEDFPINGRDQEFQQARNMQQLGGTGIWSQPTVKRKTKIVCTIAEASMNVARMNKSHGDHASHQICYIGLVKEYNAQSNENVIAIIVNCDDFDKDVEVGDMLLVDGGMLHCHQSCFIRWDGMMSFAVKSKTEDSVKCEVVDGGDLKSRRHATLPSITDKDWDDIKFGLDNKVDFYVVSFVKDTKVVHELKHYLKGCGADIHVIVKIESADSIPNLHSMITASDGAMVARGDLGAELPIEEVPLLQEEIIRQCRNQGKAVIIL
ncbi:hypothetical protein MKX03_005897 [Papaver bracteatum]|nr:hypothetical protein MKX03_005897 [Papaver bracteatum]